ncbi:Asp-tRNA(Asn)/Glu-tRNA(Gln) amidotransferase GatCAB subunit A [Candidatus Falkowbacteria bacterium CG10_big_fil_rev_8_21_14_0_10_39_9]|uniref:Glutamyl-tRNA(Gln) amidotransferase subunit A n=1 Tax=Candidatus Falkowbacteria bacterium CG10_big_fil_rev_8_21_14_0_10_39_9 TaxID=1974566 RepID=A0A2M6WNT8_9BACT|nr:MAG: Asp-tRNA(Asn)/Glu-tRNA(Gln) amidotransferase GatCAB subunit A [Candidatus Falkowbacteria bacterium CG10_big_fil_rev_8_21_14_0_10_39_9]
MNLNELTIKAARKLLDDKTISAVQLTTACLKRIKTTDKTLKALITLCEKSALAAAHEADARIAKGEKGILLGIPYLAKDNLLTKGIKTTAASKMLENYVAPYNATVIARLEAAGAILLGKTNLDEFAHGASTENSAFFTTKNPWDIKRVPGGSSGGSAAALAADFCLFALGSDTGGSIRQPASFCSVVGFKPSYGRVSRHGLMSMTSSTDVVGPITKNVEDAALVLGVIAGVDEYDSTSSPDKVDNYTKNISHNLKGLKIALPQECFGSDLSPAVREVMDKAISELKKLGAQVREISLPHTKYSIPVYYIITPSEISSNLARLDGFRYGHRSKVKVGESLNEIYLQNRGEGFGPEVKRRIMLGTYALSAGYFDAYYKKAQSVRMLISDELNETLEKFDVILTPTSPHTAFKIGGQDQDPLQMYLEDTFVSGPSLAGLPAISIPAGFIKGLPLGLQIVGAKRQEAKVFQVAHNFEQATEWHKNKAKI